MAEIIFRLRRNFGAMQMKHACSNDKLRPVITGVGLNAAHEELCCTDAHVLVIYPIEILNPEDINSEEIFSLPLFIFDRKHYFGYENSREFIMERFLYKIDTEKERVYVYSPLALNNEGFSLKEEFLLFSVPLIEGKYPNYRAVLPKEKASVDKIGIGLHFLDKLIKATRESGIGNRTDFLNRFKVTFDATLHGSNRAILLNELNQEYPIKGLIMPVMLNE